MKRRPFLILATAAALAVSASAARGQAKKSPVVIGWLESGLSASARDLAWFKEGLAASGLKEGVHFVIEQRRALPGPDHMKLHAEELATKRTAVIVTVSIAATRAAAKAAPTTPVIQARGAISPVELGLAASLARPGGTVTGLVNLADELVEERSELLRDIIPKLRRFGYLVDANAIGNARYTEYANRAASRLGFEAVLVEAARAEQLASAFARFQKSGVQAVGMLPSTWFGTQIQRIAQLALEYRLPLIGNSSGSAEAGALVSYGGERSYDFRRAAWYVDQILKGAKPGDLPIEQSSKFELVVNLKTAKALGITVPQTVMVRADRVIQ